MTDMLLIARYLIASLRLWYYSTVMANQMRLLRTVDADVIFKRYDSLLTQTALAYRLGRI